MHSLLIDIYSLQLNKRGESIADLRINMSEASGKQTYPLGLQHPEGEVASCSKLTKKMTVSRLITTVSYLEYCNLTTNCIQKTMLLARHAIFAI